jgi:hypothetical protein
MSNYHTLEASSTEQQGTNVLENGLKSKNLVSPLFLIFFD